MILLTRLDGRELVVNSDLILTVEATPDTMVTLTTGDRLLVREAVQDVVDRAVAFRYRTMQGPGTPRLSDPGYLGAAADRTRSPSAIPATPTSGQVSDGSTDRKSAVPPNPKAAAGS